MRTTMQFKHIDDASEFLTRALQAAKNSDTHTKLSMHSLTNQVTAELGMLKRDRDFARDIDFIEDRINSKYDGNYKIF